jgi:hypothetical protein
MKRKVPTVNRGELRTEQTKHVLIHEEEEEEEEEDNDDDELLHVYINLTVYTTKYFISS